MARKRKNLEEEKEENEISNGKKIKKEVKKSENENNKTNINTKTETSITTRTKARTVANTKTKTNITTRAKAKTVANTKTETNITTRAKAKKDTKPEADTIANSKTNPTNSKMKAKGKGKGKGKGKADIKAKDMKKDKDPIDEYWLTDGKNRCDFSFGSIKNVSITMLQYHDERWCKPIHDDHELYAMLVLETMQAGLSWQTILDKEQNYRNSFDQLNPVKVAKYTSKKVDELMNNPGIIRNKRKINSIINNAKAFLNVQKEFGTFDEYIWNFTDKKIIDHKLSNTKDMPAKSELSEKISQDLKKKGFQFVGPTSIYSYLQGIGMINDHTVNCDFR